MGTFWLIAVAVGVAAFIQGAIGVGFALIAAPVMGLLEPKLLPAGLLALMIPLNIYILYREREQVDRKGAGWITVGRLAGTVSGILVLVALTPHQLGMFIGMSTIGAVLLSLLVPAFDPSRLAYLASGLVTGITETATGIGGPPLALVYQHQPPAVMRSTIAFCFLVGEIVSLVALQVAGKVDIQQILAVVELLPPLALGMLFSRLVHSRINPGFLRLSVLSFASISAVILLLR